MSYQQIPPASYYQPDEPCFRCNGDGEVVENHWVIPCPSCRPEEYGPDPDDLRERRKEERLMRYDDAGVAKR